MPEDTKGLAASYEIARRRFVEAAKAAGARLASSPHPTERGPQGEELAIDVAELGPADAPNALLIVSGTHGIEGFAGSALQSRWLEHDASESDPALRVVLVHALNPFGFAWFRRTNEDNIDLNRNFIDWDEPVPVNDAYRAVADVVVPELWDAETQATTEVALLALLEEQGFEAIQQTISGGQYEFEAGVFFGGNGPAWSQRWLVDALPRLFATTERLGLIDVHTGLGPRGHGEMIVPFGRDTAEHERAASWWTDVTSLVEGDGVSAELAGEWLGTVPNLVPGCDVTSAALEFGTVDPITVLQSLRAEAWLHNYGDRTSTLGDEVRSQVRAAFLDEEPDWLQMLNARFDKVVEQAVQQLT